MEYIKIENGFPTLPCCAITLGKFDGLHRGHRKLVENVVKWKENSVPAVMFAFIAGGKTILSREERRHLADELGIDIFVECPLDAGIRRMEADLFVREILSQDFHAVNIVVGEDFRFGHARKGSPALLRKMGEQLGFSVDIIPAETDGSRKISSTFIRGELSRGNMEKAADLLGTPFRLDAAVEHGRGLGHKELLPTLNLIPAEEKLMPPNGVYMTYTHIDGGMYPGITDVGKKPTVGGTFLAAETYMLTGGRDLYGLPCRTEFLHYHRTEQKFDSLDALKNQLQKDVAAGEKYFGL